MQPTSCTRLRCCDALHADCCLRGKQSISEHPGRMPNTFNQWHTHRQPANVRHLARVAPLAGTASDNLATIKRQLYPLITELVDG